MTERNIEELRASLAAFSPTGDEAVDVAALYHLLDPIEDRPEIIRQVLPELFDIFERHPDAELGSPGPIVHAIEDCPPREFVPELVMSLLRRPTPATLDMAQRCENSDLDGSLAEPLAKVAADAHREARLREELEPSLRWWEEFAASLATVEQHYYDFMNDLDSRRRLGERITTRLAGELRSEFAVRLREADEVYLQNTTPCPQGLNGWERYDPDRQWHYARKPIAAGPDFEA